MKGMKKMGLKIMNVLLTNTFKLNSQRVTDASGTYIIFYNFSVTGNIAACSVLATKKSLSTDINKSGVWWLCSGTATVQYSCNNLELQSK
jgi:hypothetical protein